MFREKDSLRHEIGGANPKMQRIRLGVLVEVALDPLLAAALQFWLSGFCLESEFQSHSKLQSQPPHQFRQTEKIEIMDPRTFAFILLPAWKAAETGAGTKSAATNARASSM